MLFEPFKEKLNLPSACIELCYGLSREQKILVKNTKSFPVSRSAYLIFLIFSVNLLRISFPQAL